MYKVDEKLLKKEPHFPAIRPLAEKERLSTFGKLKSWFTYRRNFEILEDICFWCELLDRFIFLPQGFIVDGASVPKALSGTYSSTGVLFYGSFPHDFGYRYTGLFLVDNNNELEFSHFSKGELDDIFLDLCTQENDMPKLSWLAKSTLTMFGFVGWNENRKKNKQVIDDYWYLF